ncbi:MAG: hypothetical protein R3E54_17890 [Halioglobus sp.]
MATQIQPRSAHVVHQRLALLLLGTDDPGAAMHLQQYRETAFARRVGAVDIQQVALARIAIGQVLVHTHPGTVKMEGAQPVRTADVIGQGMLTLIRDVTPVILAQALFQGTTQVQGRFHRLDVQVRKPEPGDTKDAEPHLRERVLKDA